MAISGYFYGSTNNEMIQSRIDWVATQSVTGNYSDITATLTYSRTNAGYTTEGYWAGALTIGGNTATASGVHVAITYNSQTVALTHTARVYHNDDGTMAVTISATGGIRNPSSSSLQSTAISQQVTLDTIPRRTELSDAAGVIGKQVNLLLSKKNPAFYHSLRYKNPLDGKYYYIAADGSSVLQETLLWESTVAFLVPDLYATIPNSQEGSFVIQCWTYPKNDSSVWLGEAETAVFTYRAEEASCKPGLSGTVEDTNPATLAITGDSGVLVRYASHTRVSVTATAKNQATIDPGKGVSVQYRGAWHYDSDGQFDFAKAEHDSFILWAKDSRGFETYDIAQAKDFVPYVLLTNNAYAQRVDQTGSSVVLHFTGNYYAGSFPTAKNTLRLWYQLQGASEWTEVTADTPGVRWTVSESDHCYEVDVTLENLSYNRTFSVQTCVRDLLGEQDNAYDVYKTVVIPAGLPVFDWGETDFAFHVPVTAPSVNGVCMRSVRVWQTDGFTFQSKFSQWEAAGARQSLFLFGNRNGTPVQGVITVGSDGSCQWSGQPELTLTKQAGGAVQVSLGATAYDALALLSAEAFTIK